MLSLTKQACFHALNYAQSMSYGDRLREAITLAKSSRKALGAELGVSEQAVGMVIRGTTNSMTAENSAKAARFLRVDHFWLATGEGEPRPAHAGWPFLGITPAEFYSLDRELLEAVEDRLVGAVVRQRRSAQGGESSGSSGLGPTGTHG